jgi:hypothetical protein
MAWFHFILYRCRASAKAILLSIAAERYPAIALTLVFDWSASGRAHLFVLVLCSTSRHRAELIAFCQSSAVCWN